MVIWRLLVLNLPAGWKGLYWKKIHPSIRPCIHPSTQPGIHTSICLQFPKNQTEKIGFCPESNCVFLPFPPILCPFTSPICLCQTAKIGFFHRKKSNYDITTPFRFSVPLLPSICNYTCMCSVRGAPPSLYVSKFSLTLILRFSPGRWKIW